MDFDQPDLHLVGMAAVYRLGQVSLHLRRKLREIARDYPALRDDLEDYRDHWWRQQEENFDWLGIEDDEASPTWEFERLSDQAKKLRRELLDLLKRADPAYPAEEEYATYCAAVDVQIAALSHESEAL